MDIRWEQRLSNYIKATNKLQQSVEYIRENFSLATDEKIDNKILSEIIKEGLIQQFEYTHELAWKLMKDYAEYQGNSAIGGSRDATREALQLNLITNGDVWMDMIQSRNKTSHTYNEIIANEIYAKILKEYFPEFDEFRKVMEGKRLGK